MLGRALRLPFRLAGIPVLMDWSFLLVLPLLAWAIGSQLPVFIRTFGLPESPELLGGFRPYLLGLIAALGLFVSVVLHELGHCVLARAFGVPIRSITLWFLGGVAQFEDMPRQPGAEAAVAAVGPAVSFVIALGCWLLLAAALPLATPAVLPLAFVLAYLASANLILGVFNLVPALPLDGGRVLRSLLAIWLPFGQATSIAGAVSRVIAVLMGIVGFFTNIWLLLVAVFIYFAVASETQANRIEETLKGLRVGDLMNRDVRSVLPDMTVGELTQRMLAEHHLGFPVIDEASRLIGMVSLDQIETHPPGTLVRDVMTSDVPTITEGSPAVDAFKRIAGGGSPRLMVVDAQGRTVGILTKTDLMHALQLRTFIVETAARDRDLPRTPPAIPPLAQR